jgi:putative two-component system response regulator
LTGLATATRVSSPTRVASRASSAAADLTKAARILVVDDQEVIIRLMERVLHAVGYGNVVCTPDPNEAVKLFSEVQPDLVILDLMMPGRDGLDLLSEIRASDGVDFVPMLVLTADGSRQSRRRALAEGASDYMTKPFDLAELELRVRHLVEVRLIHQQLRLEKAALETETEQRGAALEAARLEVLERLARAAEFRDDTTGRHTWRVGRVAGIIARQLGLPSEDALTIERAARLHDIGKIGMPDHILQKRGALTVEEREIMRTHPLIGARILAGSDMPLLQVAEQMALYHHESWDGSGYCEGLRGQDIPFAARIVKVADTYDCITHERPYKRAWDGTDAVREIRAGSGTQFDPSIVSAFVEVADSGGLIELDS